MAFRDLSLTALVVLLTSVPLAHAQPAESPTLPECTGSDASAAYAEFEAGNALMAQAIDQLTHRHPDRAHALATEALGHFDQQCVLGDSGAYAERGAAFLLLGEPLRSAQSYDAYLREHPLDGLDARTRRRIEPNLQPGTLTVEVQNASGHLFIDDLDFGPLPRTLPMRLPLGDHRLEVRDAAGTVVAAGVETLSAETPATTMSLFVATPEAEVAEVVTPEREPVHSSPPPPAEHMDFLPFYITAAAVTAVGLGLGIGGLVAADERARTYNSLCFPTVIPGCDAALSERESFLAMGVAGFVLAGLGVAALVVTWVIEINQPHERVRVAIGPGGLSLSGSF